MREILFRAKSKDWKCNSQQNEWIEGYYLSKKETTYCCKEDYERFPVETIHCIAVDSMTDWGLPNKFLLYEIDPNTLCQYTGLTDKNGNKIWENDICSTDIRRPYAIVEFRNGCFMYNLNDGEKDYYDIMMPTEPLVDSDKYTEVIGNIFDNPELLDK